MKKKLIEHIVSIAERQNGTISEDLPTILNELLDENGFEKDDHIPEWMSELYYNIANQQTVIKSYFKTRLPGKGDFTNFAAELESIIRGEYDFYGEGYVLIYKNMNLKITLIYEGNFYTIEKMNIT